MAKAHAPVFVELNTGGDFTDEAEALLDSLTPTQREDVELALRALVDGDKAGTVEVTDNGFIRAAVGSEVDGPDGESTEYAWFASVVKDGQVAAAVILGDNMEAANAAQDYAQALIEGLNEKGWRLETFDFEGYKKNQLVASTGDMQVTLQKDDSGRWDGHLTYEELPGRQVWIQEPGDASAEVLVEAIVDAQLAAQRDYENLQAGRPFEDGRAEGQGELEQFNELAKSQMGMAFEKLTKDGWRLTDVESVCGDTIDFENPYDADYYFEKQHGGKTVVLNIGYVGDDVYGVSVGEEGGGFSQIGMEFRSIEGAARAAVVEVDAVLEMREAMALLAATREQAAKPAQAVSAQGALDPERLMALDDAMSRGRALPEAKALGLTGFDIVEPGHWKVEGAGKAIDFRLDGSKVSIEAGDSASDARSMKATVPVKDFQAEDVRKVLGVVFAAELETKLTYGYTKPKQDEQGIWSTKVYRAVQGAEQASEVVRLEQTSEKALTALVTRTVTVAQNDKVSLKEASDVAQVESIRKGFGLDR